ncbi:SRSF7 [Cordylochernes scorpioides]|uniref:SRSF7 n=1 Tax=Cordylochernes scorpioides TaxID=51811 RepID=A0ABY6L2F0_9ARAC|nr:SRSF7 [Cordylochernes scorpioides]
MSRLRDSPLDCKVYVGDLGSSGTKHELEDAFSYYGPLRNVWIARNPPGFAFVEFEEARDARDAVRGLDGKILCGRRVRVELSTGKSRQTYRPKPFSPEDRCYDCGERGHYSRDCKRVGRRRKSRYLTFPPSQPSNIACVPFLNKRCFLLPLVTLL